MPSSQESPEGDSTLAWPDPRLPSSVDNCLSPFCRHCLEEWMELKGICKLRYATLTVCTRQYSEETELFLIFNLLSAQPQLGENDITIKHKEVY